VYALFLTDDGIPADPARNDLDPKVHWISQEKGTRVGGLLEDRAAKYHPEMNLLQINEDFRVFNDMIDGWTDRYSHVPGAREVVKEVVYEWFEQQLIETVLGVHALKDSPEWQASQVTSAWSEEALSATVMPRYHIDFAIGRALVASQNYAINAAVAGQDLVIKGPPGTGKSQTIANMITTMSARGQRVLFVA
jgi:signal recognition particle GTPase